MEHFGFIGGHGSLESDGYTWYISGDFRHQDDILDSNRHGLWNNLDWLPWGGFNRTPGASGAENPNVAYPGTTTGYLLNPNAANGLAAQTYLPGCSAAAQAADMCTFTVPQAQLQPPTSNLDLLGKFTKALGGRWQFGLQASYFDSRSEEVQGLNPLSLLTVPYAFTNYPTGLFNFAFGTGKPLTIDPDPPLVITVPANYPGNPYGAAAPLVDNFHELGPGIITTDTATERLLASLTGDALGWDLKATAGVMYSRMIYKEFGQVEPEALQTALNNGYLLGSSEGTSLFAPSMEPPPPARWTSSTCMDHELLQLPGGPLDLALGVQWFKKTTNDTAPPTALSGVQYENGGPIYVIGTQKDTAAFAEMDGQIIKQLEVDGAVRFDHYQQFGSATTPKIGVKFTPWDWVALRGTWGKGFRVPSAAEGQESGEIFGAGAYDDRALCPNPAVPNSPGNFPSQCAFFLQGFQLPGAQLKNVKSTNWTTGIILQPIRTASVSLDYYNIKIENDIISAFEAGGRLGNYTSIIRGPQVVLPYVNSAHQPVEQMTPVGTILVANYPYVNAGATNASGYDIDLKAAFDAGVVGRFTSELTWTHELTYQLIVGGTTYELAGTHGPAGVSGDTGNPKDRATLREAWDRGPFDLTTFP